MPFSNFPWVEDFSRWFTRMLPGLEGMSYEERLDKLGLFSLERWRLRGDLIEVYKIMNRMDSQMFFPRVEKSSTRGHRFKVRGEKFRGDMRGKFLYTEGGECLERAARGGGGSRYNSGI